MSVKYDIKISKSNTKYYYKPNTNLLHREDGPAVEYINGHKAWYQNGLRHRLDGPAMEYMNGDKEWYVNGEKHRLDGPSMECRYYKEWCQYGKLHRLDGPAIEHPGGEKEYYIDNKYYEEKDYWFIIKNNLYILL